MTPHLFRLPVSLSLISALAFAAASATFSTGVLQSDELKLALTRELCRSFHEDPYSVSRPSTSASPKAPSWRPALATSKGARSDSPTACGRSSKRTAARFDAGTKSNVFTPPAVGSPASKSSTAVSAKHSRQSTSSPTRPSSRPERPARTRRRPGPRTPSGQHGGRSIGAHSSHGLR